MKNKLKDIIEKALDNGFSKHIPLTAEYLADRLIENGVILPPCKIGATVYEVIKSRKGDYSHINTATCVGFRVINAPKKRGHVRLSYIIIHYDITNSTRHIAFKRIGETIFFTKQEAEAVLQKGE